MVSLGEGTSGAYILTASHALYQSDGTQRPGCEFEPFQSPGARVPIVRVGAERPAEANEAGDRAIAELGTNATLRRMGRSIDQTVLPLEVEVLDSSPSSRVADGDVVDPSLRHVGYFPKAFDNGPDFGVSSNCRIFNHDSYADSAVNSDSVKHSCTTERGTSGGGLIRVGEGRPKVVCINSGSVNEVGLADGSSFSRYRNFNYCRPITASFMDQARQFARGSVVGDSTPATRSRTN